MFRTMSGVGMLAVVCGMWAIGAVPQSAAAQCYGGGYVVGGGGGGYHGYYVAGGFSTAPTYYAPPTRTVYVERPVYVEPPVYVYPTPVVRQTYWTGYYRPACRTVAYYPQPCASRAVVYHSPPVYSARRHVSASWYSPPGHHGYRGGGHHGGRVSVNVGW